jgi:ATP-dependent DNA helicase DinG
MRPMTDRPTASAALAAVLAHHGDARERPAQQTMLRAVEEAIATRRHLLVEAGTGTGKSLAYLVPAVLATGEPDEDEADGDDEREPRRRRAVVATATKALQEQLVGKDLPLVQAGLADVGVEFRYAMLKGRSNYVCLAKVSALTEEQLDLEGDADALAALAAWIGETDSGDRSDYPDAVADRVWAQVSTDSVECHGAANCAFGADCFAEAARRRARGSDVIVVNSHLYALDLDSGGGVLPAHDVVVLDEAHAMVEVAASAFGVTLSAGRLRHLAARLRRVLADSDLPERLDAAAIDLAAVLDPHDGTKVAPGAGELAVALQRVGTLAGDAASVLNGLDPTTEDTVTRKQQALRLASALQADVDVALAVTTSTTTQVAWVERQRTGPQLRIAPVDVGPLLAGRLPDDVTLVATSATLSLGGDFAPPAWQLGLRDDDTWTGLALDSPFDYEHQALLYCAVHLPDRRSPGFADALHDELAALVDAVGGRTLALFTSRAAMQAAATALREALPQITVLAQDERPRGELLRRLQTEPRVAVVATQSFWQGVDLPGDAVSLVTIDKLPFPRPNDPLVQARRDAVSAGGRDAFAEVDLARAATLLAQGVGRLIRTDRDRGVVAVFDRRLSFAPYAWTLVRSLPPMRRTRHRADALAFLRELAADAG